MVPTHFTQSRPRWFGRTSRSGAPFATGSGRPATDQARTASRASATSNDVAQPVTDRTSTRRAVSTRPAASSTFTRDTPRHVASTAHPDVQSKEQAVARLQGLGMDVEIFLIMEEIEDDEA